MGRVSRRLEPIRHRCERPAAIGRRESIAHDRRQRVAHGHSHSGAALTVRLAFLGTGFVTKLHSQTMKKVAPDVERWYASRDRARADAANAKFGGKGAYGSYAEALADPNVTAVLVALPPSFHLEWTTKALEAGKHVIL